MIRNPRNLQSNKSRKNSEDKNLKQSTLQSLAGVVVIEELEEAKRILESDEESVERKIQVLKRLRHKKPCKEILVKVGIGKSVRKIGKKCFSTTGELSESQVKLQKLSYSVYVDWKKELERKVEIQSRKIEVKSDKETVRLRQAAVKFLSEALEEYGSNASDLKDLSARIEKEIFDQSKGLVNSSFRKLSRRIVFALKDKTLCDSVTTSKTSVRELVTRYTKI